MRGVTARVGQAGGDGSDFSGILGRFLRAIEGGWRGVVEAEPG